ncbi:MAG TPA: 4Fe-4S binding protein [Thermodesulfobacteriaceae bacterium]|nr:4Fe-4S binding protein [Thermodesulfobacteriaceae bacterium]
MERKRRLSQYLFAVLANAYFLFPWNGLIYQGGLKKVCFPGLNCYSCPAATMSCPLGALQNFFATLRPGLRMGLFQTGAYVIGSLGLVGSFMGRMPCGWICPFGLVQDLIYKLPVPKINLWKGLKMGPYIFLCAFVFVLPLFAVDEFGYGSTWFCKYICPAGSLEAGIPLLLMDKELRSAAGWLFVHKMTILAVFMIMFSIVSRPFCRVVCPLGALFGLFNRWSWLQLKFHPDRCLQCRACRTICPTDVSFYNGTDALNSGTCIRCLRCLSICPTGAVSIHFTPVLSGEKNEIKIC